MGFKQNQRVKIVDRTDGHCFGIGEVVPAQAVKFQPLQEKPAPAPQATGKLIYAVTNKDGILELAEYRDTARELKAYYGGLKAGVTIVQYAPVKEIR